MTSPAEPTNAYALEAVGTLPTASREEVASVLAERRRTRSTASRLGATAEASHVRQGVRMILGLIEDQPGETWQHKWVAADGDILARTEMSPPHATDAVSKHRRELWRNGINALVRAGIIRPGLVFTLNPHGNQVALRGIRELHEADLDRMVNQASSVVQIADKATIRMRYAAAAMIALTGRPLHDITPAEWGAAEKFRRDCTKAYRQWAAQVAAAAERGEESPPRPPHAAKATNMVSLAAAYAAALQAGLMTPDSDPEDGKSALPATIDRVVAESDTLINVLDRLGTSIPPRVRALVHDAYLFDGAALDHSTRRRHITDLNTYMRLLTDLLPGHDSLDIPMHVRDQLLNRIRTTNNARRKNQLQRTSSGHFLSRIRAIYALCDAAITRHGLTGHLEVSGTFPWPPSVLKKLSKNEREHRRTKIKQTVRAHISHLDGLALAAEQRLVECDALAVAAHAAKRGETFIHEGVTYLRSKQKGLDHIGNGKPIIRIREVGGKSFWDVDEACYRAAQARTLVVILRETGIRAEEMAEMTLDSIIPFTDGDLTFPVLAVKPSKQDRARTVGLPVVALRAIHDLVQRSRQRFGSYPLVARVDRHENLDQMAVPLIFFTYHHRTFVGPPWSTFASWIEDVVNYYNANINTGIPLPGMRPHQFRRLFATDLAERGADPIAVKDTLGHKSLATTGIYFYEDDALAIAEVSQARRRARSEFRGHRCPCCGGLGFTPTEHPDEAHSQAGTD